MKRKIDKLAELFSPYATLYAVGGFVRDSILKLDCSDIDVCSKLDVAKVKDILSDSEFKVTDRCLRMGTVHIYSDDFEVEYTTFRTDSYDVKSGKHYPNEVLFTDDITLDAKRRDFKCNAVYLDIVQNKIVDPLGGCADIENKIISTTDDPNIVFEADGLRILRMVRFAAELGFSIDEYTYKVAKDNAWRVKDISVERIKEELDKIFVADQKHKELKLTDAHVKGLRLLDDLGLIDLLLPELANLKGLSQPVKYHLYDAFEHTIKVFELASPKLRWAALLHDIGKKQALETNGNGHMNGHEIIGETLARDIANRLKFSNDEKALLLNVVRWHMVDVKGDMSEYKIRRFIVEHYNYINELCEIKIIDCLGSCGKDEGHRLEGIFNKMKEEKVPFTVKDLKVNGKDLIDLNVPDNMRGEIMHDLLIETAMNMNLNTKDKAIEFINKRIKL